MIKTILFIVTNGVGLGHLTRGLAVASKMRVTASEYQYIFLTTSIAVNVLKDSGFQYYYIPSRELYTKKYPMKVWYQMLRDTLKKITKQHNVIAWIYDGAYPYIPLLEKFEGHANIKKIWIKREGDRPCYLPLRKLEHFFNLVIVPGEIGLKLQRNNCELISPIIYIPNRIQSREEGLHSLDKRFNKEYVFEQHNEYLCKQSNKCLIYYVQLGAGKINEINETIHEVIDCIVRDSNNYVILGESIIGDSIQYDHERVAIIKEYPNSIYFNCIDIAISAAGYNTFHELLYFGIPTVFIPNTKTTKDDQVARARRAEELQVGLCALTKDEIKSAIEDMSKNYLVYKENLKNVKYENGADQAIRKILEVIT